MDFSEMVLRARSYRRFDGASPIGMDDLRSLVDLARQTPSGMNLQPLRYVLCNDPARNTRIFDCLKWAGYLNDWDGPAEGERPTAYIILLAPKSSVGTIDIDSGIAAQTILLGAVQKGLGGCILGSVDRDQLASALSISEDHQVILVLALGVPSEKVVIEPIRSDGDIKYYRDDRDVHHVPKISLEDVVVRVFGA